MKPNRPSSPARKSVNFYIIVESCNEPKLLGFLKGLS